MGPQSQASAVAVPAQNPPPEGRVLLLQLRNLPCFCHGARGGRPKAAWGVGWAAKGLQGPDSRGVRFGRKSAGARGQGHKICCGVGCTRSARSERGVRGAGTFRKRRGCRHIQKEAHGVPALSERGAQGATARLERGAQCRVYGQNLGQEVGRGQMVAAWAWGSSVRDCCWHGFRSRIALA